MAITDTIMRIVLTAETREAIAGLKAVSNEVKNTGQEVTKIVPTIDKASDSVTTFGTSFKQALQGLGSAALIGGAIAGIALLAEVIHSAVLEMNAAEKAQQKLNDTLETGKASVQGEISGISGLIAVVKDETETRETRARAFKQLQDQYPNAFKNMSLEKTSIEDIQTATDKLTEALVRQAKIKGLESAITDIYKEQAKIITDTGLKQFDIFEKIQAFAVGAAKGLGDVGKGGLQIGEAFNTIKDDHLKGVALQAAKLQEALNALIKTSVENNDQGILGGGAHKDIDEGKALLGVLEQIKRVKDDIAKPSTEPIFKQQANSDPTGIDARVIEQRISEAIQGGIEDPKNKAAFTELANQLKILLEKTTNPDIHARIRFDLQGEGGIENPADAIQKEFRKLDKEGFLKLNIGGFDQAEVRRKFDEDSKFFLQQLSTFSNTIKGAIESAIGGIAESFGTALGTGDLDKALSQLGNVLAGALRAIGGAYIKAGTAALIAKSTFEKFLVANPILSIAAGVGLEILAGVLKSQVGKTKAFADGGIVTGPTVGLVGEAGPEVIFPLERLNQFIRGANTNTNVNVGGGFTLQGGDLILAIQRAQKNNNLRS